MYRNALGETAANAVNIHPWLQRMWVDQVEAPTVLLDVDGVLVDFVGALQDRWQQMRRSPAGTKMYSLGLSQEVTGFFDTVYAGRAPGGDFPTLTRWDLKGQLPDDFLEGVRNDPCFAYSVKPYPGAASWVANLRRLGARVLAVTADGWHRSKLWEYTRIQLLQDAFGFEPAEILFCSPDAKACIPGNVLVEDNPETLRKWWDGVSWANNTRAWLVGHSYNKADQAQLQSKRVRVSSDPWDLYQNFPLTIL